jgi:hypothetical protein
MNSKDFKAMLSSGTLTRRQMNKLLASTGVSQSLHREVWELTRVLAAHVEQ